MRALVSAYMALKSQLRPLLCDQVRNNSDPVSSLGKGDSNSSYLGVVWIKTDNRLERV